MKQNKNNLRNKIWVYLIIFSVTTISFLWIFQVLFLNKYYEWMKTNEISRIADEIKNNYDGDLNILDNLSFNEGICIDVVYENTELYSSNSLNRGCMGLNSKDRSYIENKIDFKNSDYNKKIYKLVNTQFNNKIVMCGIKLDNNLYVFINSSVEILSSTTSILASQLVYVTILVMLLSLVISYFISKKISKPIVKINTTAKKMALGDYNIKFEIDENIDELNELVNTLNEANYELSKTDNVRRELLANISHDLKTPLTMIKAYAEMIRDLSYNDKKKTINNLNTIIDETDRLNLLVNDILDLSKIQSNIETLNKEEFDLNETIISIISRFDYLKEKKICKIDYIENNQTIIYADKKKIEQVIYNLISNATNYVGKDKLIIVKLIILENSYRVEIIDHGKGIKAADLELIWDKYYKTDKTYNRNNNGTGLGLSIVKNILLMHNYKYGVDSKENNGTTFYFEIKK